MCMYVCSVEGGGALGRDDDPCECAESTTVPTCECACMYVCVQCMKEGGGALRGDDPSDDPRVNHSTYM